MEAVLSVYPDAASWEETAKEIVAYFEHVLERLDAVGFDVFFGGSTGSAVLSEMEWFSDQAWNTAITASKAHHTLLFA